MVKSGARTARGVIPTTIIRGKVSVLARFKRFDRTQRHAVLATSDSGREYGPAGGSITITLVEAQQHLLSGFPTEARAVAENYLREQGVTIIIGKRITGVRQGSVVLAAGTELPQSMLIWTGGIKPSRLIELPF